MTPVLRLTRLGQLDLEEIFHYIARDNPSAARRVVAKIYSTCEQLAASPELGEIMPQIDLSLRRCTVENFLIFYRPIVNGIVVARILHAARDWESMF